MSVADRHDSGASNPEKRNPVEACSNSCLCSSNTLDQPPQHHNHPLVRIRLKKLGFDPTVFLFDSNTRQRYQREMDYLEAQHGYNPCLDYSETDYARFRKALETYRLFRLSSKQP